MRSGLKPSGFVRHMDDLGRVVLPVEWRRTQQIEPGAPMELIPGGDGTLVLRRYVPTGTCTFCGSPDDTQPFAGRPVCRTCAAQIGPALGA